MRNRSPGVAEQRREIRLPAKGEVRIRLDEPVRVEFEGHLMDTSPKGFRASHTCSSLGSGQLVHFRHAVASGTARVIWNRILDHRVETGFLIL
jgi:hypothetical protein